MDYRYYYETTDAARTEPTRRVGVRMVLAAGLAVEAAAAAAPSLGTPGAPAAALACAAAALTAFVLRHPLGRILERTGYALRSARATPAV